MRIVPIVVLACLAVTAPSEAQTVTVRLPPSTPTPSESVAAQTGPPQAKPFTALELRELAKKARASLRDLVMRAAYDPALRARTTNAAVQAVAFEVGKDGEAVGKAQLSWRLDDYNSAVDVVLKGPLKAGAGVALNERGLASGASATVGYNLTLWGAEVTAATELDIPAVVTGDGRGLSSLEAVIATGVAVQAEGTTGDRVYANQTVEKLNKDRTDAFASRNPELIALALHRSGAARLTRTLALRGSYGIGSTTFNFSELGDPIADSSETKRDTSQAISLSYLQLLREKDVEAPLMMITGGYARSDGWRPGRTRQICTPLGVASATECRSLVIGAPTSQVEKSLDIDIRSWAYTQRLGLNPHFSYDPDLKKWSSEVGLSYLVLKKQDDENGLPQLDTNALTVGVRVGSRPADQGGVYASVFFASVLSR